jgi:hypothetical protein
MPCRDKVKARERDRIYRLLRRDEKVAWMRAHHGEQSEALRAARRARYALRGDKAREARRLKYQTDPEYRARILASNQRSRRKKKDAA